MKKLKLINPENVSEEEVKTYRTREAGRAVVIDENGMIALLYVVKEKYYKLPGGKIEEGEDKINALVRECKEEVGCNIEILNEIGFIVEYRKKSKLKQTSYCYLTKVKGNKGVSNFTEKEKGNGFKQMWLSYDEALKALSESRVLDRDATFLKEAKHYLDNIIKL